MIERVPVKVNGIHMGDYELVNLFTRYGNEDGNNPLMCAVAAAIIDAIEAELEYGVVREDFSAHNPYVIWELEKDGRTVWELKESHDEVTEELWNSLPDDVRRLFEKLAREGVELSL
jgi:hypothetical protein